MNEEFQIVYIDDLEESAWGIIGKGVGTYNKQQVGDNRFQRLCFVLQGPDKKIVGGVMAETYWEWLHIDLLWVKDELRGRGYGHLLLEAVEQEARQRGAKNAYLDTFSFQAPRFYKQHGYQIFGELQDFPPGHKRFFLRKPLSENHDYS
jgi:GNAT superfamily N-acetyltransferase